MDLTYIRIDQALPLSQRQASLKARYHFLCACPRCAQNMDVYEACRQYPDLDANEASLATDIKDILPLQSKQPSSHNTTTANIQQRYHSSLPALPLQAADSEAATEQDLRRRWTLCQPLLTLQSQASTPTPPGMKIPWATHPLPEILTEAAIHLSSSSSSSPSSSSSSSSSRYASALSLCALQATHIEPVRSPFPNSPGRIKGLLMLVKLLAFTAAPSPSSLSASQSLSTAAAASAAAVEAPIRRVLDSMDIPTTCEVLLLFVLGSATSWQDQQETQRYLVQPYHREAQEMLEDIRSLPGRDSERASVQKLFQSYSRGESGSGSGTSGGAGDEENRLFLDMVIVKPLREIASFARDVMDAEFGSAVSSADAASGIS